MAITISNANSNISDTTTSYSLTYTGGVGNNVTAAILVNGTLIGSASATSSPISVSYTTTNLWNAATGSSLSGAVTFRVSEYTGEGALLSTSSRTGGTITIGRKLTSAVYTTADPYSLDSPGDLKVSWTRPHTAFRGRVKLYVNGSLILTRTGFSTSMTYTPTITEVNDMIAAMGGVSPRNMYYTIETGFVADTTVYYTSGAISTPTSGNTATKVFLVASTIAISNFTLSSATSTVPYTLTVGTSGATHEVRLYIKVGTTDYLIQTHTGITGSGNFSITSTQQNLILDNMPTQTSATTWAWVRATKDGSTADSNSQSTATTVTLDAAYKPSIASITLVENNTYLHTITASVYFLTAKSNPKLSGTITAARGAAISTTKVDFAGVSSTLTSSTLSPVITLSPPTSVGTARAYTVTVTDARGRVGTATGGSFTIRAYTYPKVNSYSAERVDAGNTLIDPLGTRVRLTLNVQAYSLLNASGVEQNHVRWVIVYRLRPGGAWTAYTSNVANSTLTISTTSSLATTFAITNSYDFRIRAYDRFYDLDNTGTLDDPDDFAEDIQILPFGKVSLMIGEDKVAIGKVWTAGTLDVGGDVYSNGTRLARIDEVGGSDASTLNGYASDTAATANTIARRDPNGYIYGTYFNQSSGGETSAASFYMYQTGSDGFVRKKPIANVKAEIQARTVSTLDPSGGGANDVWYKV